MSDVLNPVQIEEAIRLCANRIANSVTVCGARYDEFLTAEREFDRAYAHAYLNAPGPAHAKKFEATLATMDERAAKDVADAAFKYAERTSRAIEAELRAWQSVGASVRAMYGVAGRGEGS